ncbi:hypothetical protein NSERUTF1_5806 [Nocardia seriolae]|nr:hypothetical protein NSERUTF1_5806 [Nocardia seriolae]
MALRAELAAAIGDDAVVAHERGRVLTRSEAVAAIEACLAAVRMSGM